MHRVSRRSLGVKTFSTELMRRQTKAIVLGWKPKTRQERAAQGLKANEMQRANS
jgi:hypothetical protein